MKYSVYPETFFENCLQREMSFSINNKITKKGRLFLYKKQHYFIQLSLINDKNIRENFEIPIPFDVEFHFQDNLAYFDYRMTALKLERAPFIVKKITSNFFNKILEISF